MIQEFSAQNFRSFSGKETISFVASKDKHLLEELTIEVKPKLRLLRMAMVFGANASGKSNLLLAMNAMWQMLSTPKNERRTKIELFQPFVLKKKEPTSMNCIFWAMERCYHYEIEYNEVDVLYEKLQYKTDSDVLSLMYERKKGEEIKFGSTLDIKAQERNDLNKDTLHNHTVLATFGKTNIKVPLLEGLHQWITNHICKLGEYGQATEIAKEAEEKPELKVLILDLMREADFNISDFELVEAALPKELMDKVRKILAENEFPDNQKEYLLESQKLLLFKHQTASSNYSIDFSMESAGTQTYFRLARLLFNLKSPGYVFIEDALEEKLHYELLLHYLQTYLETPSQSQLLFTSHNLLLLDEDWLMRRDMVHLIERNKETGASQLSRVSDMGLHKNMSMLNAYRIGKLGGKPRLGSTYLSI